MFRYVKVTPQGYHLDHPVKRKMPNERIFDQNYRLYDLEVKFRAKFLRNIFTSTN